MVKSQDICCVYSARSSVFNLVWNHVMVLPLAWKRSTSRSLPWSDCPRGGEAGKVWLISQLGWQDSTNTSQPTALAFCSEITNQPAKENGQKSEILLICLFEDNDLDSFSGLFCFFKTSSVFYLPLWSLQKQFFPYWASCNIWETDTLGKLWQGSDIQNLFELLIPLGFKVYEGLNMFETWG